MTRLTGDGSVPLLRLAQFGDADIVVEHGPDLLLVGNELIAEDHLFLGVVEAAHLYARKSDSLNERRCLFSDHRPIHNTLKWQTCTSSGNESNIIGQMNVMRVATAYIISDLLRKQFVRRLVIFFLY